MDYVTHLKPDGTYQPLREHEENVAALAGAFAAGFGAREHGYRAGLLHDIGKYSANGQKRQRDPAHTAKVDHASAGQIIRVHQARKQHAGVHRQAPRVFLSHQPRRKPDFCRNFDFRFPRGRIISARQAFVQPSTQRSAAVV